MTLSHMTCIERPRNVTIIRDVMGGGGKCQVLAPYFFRIILLISTHPKQALAVMVCPLSLVLCVLSWKLSFPTDGQGFFFPKSVKYA
jgi:hypothetical protein